MAVKYGFDEDTGMPNEEQPAGLQNVRLDFETIFFIFRRFVGYPVP